MATKRKAAPRTAELPGVTAERFTRLYRLVQLLGDGPHPRQALAKRLHLDVRGFYRDLEVLRASGIEVSVTGGRYGLVGKIDDSLSRLPFPDPHITLGEAMLLRKGRSPAHKRLEGQIDHLVP